MRKDGYFRCKQVDSLNANGWLFWGEYAIFNNSFRVGQFGRLVCSILSGWFPS